MVLKKLREGADDSKSCRHTPVAVDFFLSESLLPAVGICHVGRDPSIGVHCQLAVEMNKNVASVSSLSVEIISEAKFKSCRSCVRDAAVPRHKVSREVYSVVTNDEKRSMYCGCEFHSS